MMDFSMEGCGDSVHLENEGSSPAAETGQLDAAEPRPETDRWGTAEEAAPKMDSDPEYKACSVEEDGACSSPSAESPSPGTSQLGATESEDLASSKPPAMAMLGSAEPPPAPRQRPSKVSIAEMDCLVCFNRYSALRPPKLLACQHAFCGVCLKLILRNEDRTWLVTCPLCRKATVVFGGLICSLRDKDDVLGRLETPDPDAEVPGPPETPHQSASGTQERSPDGTARVAAKRLVLLLLLVAVLILLLLPFVYTGLLKWALCLVVLLGLVMSGLLCCNLSLPSWRKKESHVASVA